MPSTISWKPLIVSAIVTLLMTESAALARKVQEVPGILQGGLGWQGIVPARAAKMGSIAVDKAIAKIGTPKEFYQQLDPPVIGEHIVSIMEPKVPEIVDGVMRRQHPQLWRSLPPRLKDAIIQRVNRNN